MNSQVNGENNNIWRSETEESIKRCKGFTERRYLDIVLKEENRALMGKKGTLLKRSQRLDHFTRGQETSFCWVSTKWKDSMYFPFSHLIFITALQNRWCYSWFPYEGKIRLTAVTVIPSTPTPVAQVGFIRNTPHGKLWGDTRREY